MTSSKRDASELPIGEKVDSSPADVPQRCSLAGQYVTLEALDPTVHGESLWANLGGAQHEMLWVYIFDGPYLDREAFDEELERKAASQDYLFFAIVDNQSTRALGLAAYVNVYPAHRSIEVGSILYSPALQRTRGATEAMYLMARHAFEDLGYRRYEWKCNVLNESSREAAARLGFTFEGIFRQHRIVKGHNRDTAWFSMLDCEWPARKAAFERWLAPTNFDAEGGQKAALSELIAAGRPKGEANEHET
jgi:RimJ/RimL family protein N-acetyltransferase